MTVSQVSSAEINTFIRVAANLPQLLQLSDLGARPTTAALFSYDKPPQSTLTHNDCVALIHNRVQIGEFGRAEIADLFTGNPENLIQVALRDLDTMLVRIVNLRADGTIGPSPA